MSPATTVATAPTVGKKTIRETSSPASSNKYAESVVAREAQGGIERMMEDALGLDSRGRRRMGDDINSRRSAWARIRGVSETANDHSRNSTSPVFISYMAPTILIFPASSISFRIGLRVLMSSMVKRTLFSATM
jgi:hypothetical protein